MFGYKKNKPARITLLDGPLSPNEMLEQAEALPVADPDDLCLAPDGSLLVSSGKSVLRLKDWSTGIFDLVGKFDQEVSALACRDDGQIAVGLKNAGIQLITLEGQTCPDWQNTEINIQDVSACCFSNDGSLLIADTGIEDKSESKMKDLFRKSGKGRVIQLNEKGVAHIIANNLQFPYGLTQTETSEVIVCESWSASIHLLAKKAVRKTVFQDAPGYPARINRTSNGGYILSLFSRRDPIIEFVLSEPVFMERMINEIEPQYWIAPRLTPNKDHRIPVQMGATRLFGETKPWAPSLSYGLIIILDKDFTPIASAQSRADGKRHGITSALEWQGHLIAISKGNNELLRVTEMSKLT